MAQVLQSPSSSHHFPSPSSSSSTSCAVNDEDGDTKERDGDGEQLSLLTLLVDVLRKSLIGCSISGTEELCAMEIGLPTNVRHVAHVTFDRFNGFLGLPVEFEPEVPRRAPSASASVFGVSTESMQLSFDTRGNSVPTILLLMQRHLYTQGGLQAEGIFRLTADNSQEEYVREQLNRGVVPENVDVHCLAGLIKAWFRELPIGVLDSLSPEQVIQSQTEDECTQLVRLLPPTEAALLDWAVNLMADVAQLEHVNRMNAHNVAMVFAPNMTQMADPLTALMYAVQVMNFLKTLVIKTLREREDCVIEASPASHMDPADEDGHQNSSQAVKEEAAESTEEEQVFIGKESSPKSSTEDDSAAGNRSANYFFCVENAIPGENCSVVDSCSWDDVVDSLSSGCLEDDGLTCVSCNWDVNKNVKEQMTTGKAAAGLLEKNKGTSIVERINLTSELNEAWR